MDPTGTQWPVMAINGVLIALVITLPLFIGVVFLSALRRGIRKERQSFETRVISLREEIKQAQNR